MLVFLVALIAAVLLFGSSAVLGALGAVLGFIAACIALAAASAVFNIDPGYIVLGLLALLVILFLVFAPQIKKAEQEAEMLKKFRDDRANKK